MSQESKLREEKIKKIKKKIKKGVYKIESSKITEAIIKSKLSHKLSEDKPQ